MSNDKTWIPTIALIKSTSFISINLSVFLKNPKNAHPIVDVSSVQQSLRGSRQWCVEMQQMLVTYDLSITPQTASGWLVCVCVGRRRGGALWSANWGVAEGWNGNAYIDITATKAPQIGNMSWQHRLFGKKFVLRRSSLI